MGALTSCCQQRWAEKAERGGVRPPVPPVLSQNPLREFEHQKDRKCDPGLITAGSTISENRERRANKEVSVLFPVGCFVRCQRLNVSLCVKNELFVL